MASIEGFKEGLLKKSIFFVEDFRKIFYYLSYPDAGMMGAWAGDESRQKRRWQLVIGPVDEGRTVSRRSVSENGDQTAGR
jgi:hypothetical protein